MGFDVKGDIDQCKKNNKSYNLQVAPFAPRDDFAACSGRKQKKKSRICCQRRSPSDVVRNGYGNAPDEPDREKAGQRQSLDRQSPRPVWDRGEQKACDDGSDIAEQHFMDMPVERRESRREGDFAGKGGKPKRNHQPRLNRAEQEKRPESI